MLINIENLSFLKYNQKVNDKSHFVWADIVRSLAIFLVVYIHTRPDISGTFPFLLIFRMLDFASAICIALFILLSGALLLAKQEKITTFVRKRLFKIFVPWVCWVIIWFIFENSTLLHRTQNGFYIAHIFLRYFFSRFWFLPIIFGVYLFTPFLRLFIMKHTTKTLTLYLILWFILFIILPIIFLYRGIYNPSNTVLTIFQFLGIYFLGYMIVGRYKPSNHIFFWVGLFFLGIIIQFTELHILRDMMLARTTAFPYNYISPELIIIALGAFTSIYILFNGKYKNSLNPSIKNLLATISRCALGIYLTHEFFIILFFKLSIPSVFLLEKTLFVFSLSCIFVVFLNKIRFTRILVP